jgi:cyclic-di-GMP-binding protein
MAQTGQVAKEMYQALSEISCAELDPKDLLGITESLRLTVQWTCQHLKKHYVNKGSELDPKQFTIVNLSQTLQMHLILNYKGVIDELAQQDVSKSDIKKIL